MRLSSDFFASAYIRRCGVEGAFAALRRRGGAQAGAIFILIDRLDGTGTLYGPAAQASYSDDNLERAFSRLHKGETMEREDIEAKLEREITFDPDCWIIEVEERSGKHFLDRIL